MSDDLSSFERDRLSELRVTGLLDSPPEEAFDRITRLARRLLKVDIALISFVDEDRQFFKSHAGLTGEWAESRQSPLSHSFCRYAVATGARFVIEDARESALMRENPAVAEQGVIAYAGQPLETAHGNVLGTLCVIDNDPRDWTEDELELLGELASLASTEIEYRLQTKQLQEIETLVRQLQEPVEQIGDAVRGGVSLTEHTDDPRLGRMAGLARSRMADLERVAQDLQRHASLGPARGHQFVDLDLSVRLGRAQELALASARAGDLLVDVRDQPLMVRCDPYEIDRALARLLTSALHHATLDQVVDVALSRDQDLARLDVFSPGLGMPVADLVRTVSRFDRVSSMVPGSGAEPGMDPTITSRGRVTSVENGPVRGVSGPEGTRLIVQLPLI